MFIFYEFISRRKLPTQWVPERGKAVLAWSWHFTSI